MTRWIRVLNPRLKPDCFRPFDPEKDEMKVTIETKETPVEYGGECVDDRMLAETTAQSGMLYEISEPFRARLLLESLLRSLKKALERKREEEAE